MRCEVLDDHDLVYSTLLVRRHQRPSQVRIRTQPFEFLHILLERGVARWQTPRHTTNVQLLESPVAGPPEARTRCPQSSASGLRRCGWGRAQLVVDLRGRILRGQLRPTNRLSAPTSREHDASYTCGCPAEGRVYGRGQGRWPQRTSGQTYRGGKTSHAGRSLVRIPNRKWRRVYVTAAPLDSARWWAHVVGALRDHPHKHCADYPAKKVRGFLERRGLLSLVEEFELRRSPVGLPRSLDVAADLAALPESLMTRIE
jgi:hypothetical protein